MRTRTRVLAGVIAVAGVAIATFVVLRPASRPDPVLPALPAPPAQEQERVALGLADDGARREQRTERSAAIATLPAEALAAAAPTLLRIQVVALGSLDPIAGARVLAAAGTADHLTSEAGRVRGILGDTLVTDANGRVEFACEPARAVKIYVTAEFNRSMPLVSEIPALEPRETREVRIELDTRPDLTMCLRVVAASTGQPIPGARAGPATGWGRIAPENEQLTDGSGLVCVRIAKRMYAALTVSAEGCAPALVVVEPRRETMDTALTVELARSATLEVRALDEHELPLAGATIRIESTIVSVPDTALRRLDRVPPRVTSSRALRTSLDDPSWEAVSDATGVARFQDLPPDEKLRVYVETSAGVAWGPSDELRLSAGGVGQFLCRRTLPD